METKENNKEMVTIKLFSIHGEYILGQNLEGVTYKEKAVQKPFHNELPTQERWVTTFEMEKEMIPKVTEQLFNEIEKVCPRAGDMDDDEYYDYVPDAIDQYIQFGYHTGQLDSPDFRDDLVLLRNTLYTDEDGYMDEREAYDVESYFDGPATFGLTWDEI